MNDTNTPKSNMATMLANLKKKANPELPAVETAPVIPVVAEPVPAIAAGLENIVGDPLEVPKVEEAEYQQYTAARVSTCLITPTGKRINFSDYQYYTKDPEIIRYLDREIATGLKGFVKGELLTASELDPEAAKKREIIEEFKASQEGREFGSTKPESERTSALNSGQVASGASA